MQGSKRTASVKSKVVKCACRPLVNARNEVCQVVRDCFGGRGWEMAVEDVRRRGSVLEVEDAGFVINDGGNASKMIIIPRSRGSPQKKGQEVVS